MNYTILDGYDRRGKKVWATAQVSGFGALQNTEGEEYTKSYVWIELVYIKEKFQINLNSARVHESYPLPEEINLNEVEKAFNESETAMRALAMMKSTKKSSESLWFALHNKKKNGDV